MSNYNYICRKASFDDDFEQIAKYIHLTDPYIYPTITQNPTDKIWINFISECLKIPNNIFCIENISVIIHYSDIIGIACVIPCKKELTIFEDFKKPIKLSDNIQSVIDGYFKPLIQESLTYDGYNITNICIDEDYRNKGLGGALMAHCIKEYGSQVLHLDVIAANKTAVHLYQKFGFRIESEYFGFSGDTIPLPCYHMIRS